MITTYKIAKNPAIFVILLLIPNGKKQPNENCLDAKKPDYVQ